MTMFQQPSIITQQPVPDHIQMAQNMAKAINEMPSPSDRIETLDTIRHIVEAQLQDEYNLEVERQANIVERCNELNRALSRISITAN